MTYDEIGQKLAMEYVLALKNRGSEPIELDSEVVDKLRRLKAHYPDQGGNVIKVIQNSFQTLKMVGL